MNKNKKLKEYETVWTCDFCGKEFKTKKESDKHEVRCNKNKDKIAEKYFYIIGVVIFLITFSFFIKANYSQEKVDNKTQVLIPIVSSPSPSPIPTKIINQNPDIVTCTFDPRCKHEPVKLKRSDCQKIVCCHLGLDVWAVAMSSSECQKLQKKAMDIYNSIYKEKPITLTDYKFSKIEPVDIDYVNVDFNDPTSSIDIPTTTVSQSNISDYTTICVNQYNTDIFNSKQLSSGARESMEQIAKENYDRCMQTGVSQPLKVTRPSPTPTIIQGIWYGNLGPLQ